VIAAVLFTRKNNKNTVVSHKILYIARIFW